MEAQVSRHGDAGRVPVLVTARLNAKLRPADRGDFFEDPLSEALEAEGLGEVTGGGTQLCDPPYGIAFCDLEIALVDASDAAIGRVIAHLERLGAPKGSKILFDGPDGMRAPRAFGVEEGLALALNGTDLPPETYADSDVNELIRTLVGALGKTGAIKGHWEGPRETMLYFYGPRFDDMRAAIAPIIEARPDTQMSRVERIA